MKPIYYLLAISFSLGTFAAHAQEDDVYYVPTTEQKAAEKAERSLRSSYSELPERHTVTNDNWAKGRRSSFDTDTYNRRKGSMVDNRGQIESNMDDDDWSYTTRLVRFYSPTGIIVSSPYYLDYYDYWYSPYSYRYYDPFEVSWGWNWNWGRPWRYNWSYYRGWYSPWYSGWYSYYSPWYDNWGWGVPRYYTWDTTPNWHYKNYERGPVGGGRSFSGTNNNRSNERIAPSRRYESSRSFNERNYNTTPNRNYNVPNNSTQRTYQTPSQPRTYSSPSSPSTPRSYGGGGSVSTGSSSGSRRTFGR